MPFSAHKAWKIHWASTSSSGTWLGRAGKSQSRHRSLAIMITKLQYVYIRTYIICRWVNRFEWFLMTRYRNQKEWKEHLDLDWTSRAWLSVCIPSPSRTNTWMSSFFDIFWPLEHIAFAGLQVPKRSTNSTAHKWRHAGWKWLTGNHDGISFHCGNKWKGME